MGCIVYFNKFVKRLLPFPNPFKIIDYHCYKFYCSFCLFILYNIVKRQYLNEWKYFQPLKCKNKRLELLFLCRDNFTVAKFKNLTTSIFARTSCNMIQMALNAILETQYKMKTISPISVISQFTSVNDCILFFKQNFRTFASFKILPTF